MMRRAALIFLALTHAGCIAVRDNPCDSNNAGYDLNACLPLCQATQCESGLTSAVTSYGCECLTCDDIQSRCSEQQYYRDCQCLPLNGVVTCAGAGQCTIACSAGYSDCNGDSSDGCEIAIATDASHCGACGQICGTGNCSDGKCGGGIIVQAAHSIDALTVDANAVYYLEEGAGDTDALLKRRALGANDTPTVLASGLNDRFPDHGIVTDATHVYWGNFGSDDLRRVAKSGGSVQVVTSNEVSWGGMFVHAGSVYFSFEDTATRSPRYWRVMKVAATGGTASRVANTTEGLYGLSTDGVSYVYWASGSGSKELYRAPLGASDQSGTRLLSRSNHTATQGICVDGSTVYWALSGQTASSGGNAGEILRVTVSGSSGSVDRVLATYAYVYSLACNSTHIFWSARTADSTYGIWRAAKGSDLVEMVPGAEGTANTGEVVANETAVFVLGTNKTITAFPLN